jgi:hypothetical protein
MDFAIPRYGFEKKIKKQGSGNAQNPAFCK